MKDRHPRKPSTPTITAADQGQRPRRRARIDPLAPGARRAAGLAPVAGPDDALMQPRIFFARAVAPGEVLALPEAESRHLQVLRLQPGDAVVLFNGDDGLEWQAEVTRIG